MQQLSWKNFPVKIEKSLCKLFGPKYAPNPVHNSVTIYSAKALSVFLCIKGGFAAPAARRLTRPLAPATVGFFRSYRRTPQAFPLGGRWRAAPDEGSPVPPAGAILFPKNQKGSTPAGCSLSVVLYLFFPLSATMPVRDRRDRTP